MNTAFYTSFLCCGARKYLVTEPTHLQIVSNSYVQVFNHGKTSGFSIDVSGMRLVTLKLGAYNSLPKG